MSLFALVRLGMRVYDSLDADVPQHARAVVRAAVTGRRAVLPAPTMAPVVATLDEETPTEILDRDGNVIARSGAKRGRSRRSP